MAWALITGASEGLGREFADLAAADGFDLILSARQEARLEALAETIRSRHGREVTVLPADLAAPGAAGALWDRASDGREIAVLVNNAGLGHIGPFRDPAGAAREDQSVAVNVTAATVLMKRAAGTMAARGSGRILNVASTAGFLPGPGMAVYHATKAYLLSLSEAAATELRGSGVTVTALCPGATETNFFVAADAVKATWLTRLFPMLSARWVAEKGWRAMQAGKRVQVTGAINHLFAFAPRITPRPLLAWVAGQFLARR